MNLAIDFPPISHAVEWRTLFGGDWFGVNKVVLLMWISVVLVLFLVAFGYIVWKNFTLYKVAMDREQRRMLHGDAKDAS